MGRFSTGLMAGSILGAIGVGMIMNDTMTRRKMIKNGKKFMYKAEDVLDAMADSVADTMDSMM